jgi:hypothetical protein
MRQLVRREGHERHFILKLVEALCYKPEGRVFDSDLVTGFFNRPNPSSRTVSLGSTRPLTERVPGILLGCKGRPARKADSLTTICEPIV